MKTLIDVPQQSEIAPLLNGFDEIGVESVSTTLGTLPALHLPEIDAAIVTGGHGKAQFAATTSYVLCKAETERAVCVGAAGSLTREIGLGDIVIADATIEHDYRIKFATCNLPTHSGHPATLDELRQTVEANHFPFRVRFGGIASGDEDVVDSTRAAELHAITEALCVAWEGSGGARAAKLHGIPFVEIRVITDSADKQAAVDFHANLRSVMPNVSRLIGSWCR